MLQTDFLFNTNYAMYNLPNELLLLVFNLLSGADIKALRRVSKRVSRVAALYQFRHLVLWDSGKSRSRIKRAVGIVNPYLGQTQ